MEDQGKNAQAATASAPAGRTEDSRRSRRLFALFTLFNTNPEQDHVRCLEFLKALADLSPGEFDRALAETLRNHRSSFAPTPGEIRGYLERSIAESRPVGSLARPDCPKCWGTGYVIVTVDGANYAVRCKCLQRTGAPS